MAKSMEVILLERIDKLGLMGDVVKVRPGYARNYLLLQKKALRSSRENRELFAHQRVVLEADNLVRRQEAEAVAARLEGINVVVISAAEERGTLYGSVGSREVTSVLAENGFKVARSQVLLKQAIKTLGLHSVAVVLHPEVRVQLTVNVARSAAEAEQQLRLVRGEREPDQSTQVTEPDRSDKSAKVGSSGRSRSRKRGRSKTDSSS